jgi:hypothetical protein
MMKTTRKRLEKSKNEFREVESRHTKNGVRTGVPESENSLPGGFV